jgi:hemerythrin
MDEAEEINWTSRFSIGNTSIDNVHMQLIETYNELADFVRNNGDRKEFAKILSKMTDYCLNHFKREEEYMLRMTYPKLEEHRQIHHQYWYRVSVFNSNLLGLNPPDSKIVLSFLKSWWINHILTNDLDYERFKNKINSDVVY